MKPSKIFDSHFHIIDPKYPLIPNQGYLPPEFTTEMYLERMKELALYGGAVVSGSFQAFDQSYLLNALKTLGKNFVGVTQIPSSITDEEIIQLNEQGVRAVRFNLKRGGSAGIEDIENLAARVYSLVKWHSEFYVDSRDLETLLPKLLKLKKISIDHLGLSKEGLPYLKKLVEKGAFVKVTFGRVEFEMIPVIKELSAINQSALTFGSDLPGTRALRLFENKDIQFLIDGLGENLSHKILYENGLKLYNLSLE